jgi:hypothetical protein
MHLSYAQIPRRKWNTVNLEDVFRFVSPDVRDAALQSAAQLRYLGIRFALAGGLAVGAHGYVRATQDVDFLVGDEAFEHHGALVTFKAGVPIEVGGIRIDYLSASALGQHLTTALEQKGDSLPVVPLPALVFLKLLANRRKDQLDVVELLRVGGNARATREYLELHASDYLSTFEELLKEAQE